MQRASPPASSVACRVATGRRAIPALRREIDLWGPLEHLPPVDLGARSPTFTPRRSVPAQLRVPSDACGAASQLCGLVLAGECPRQGDRVVQGALRWGAPRLWGEAGAAPDRATAGAPGLQGPRRPSLAWGSRVQLTEAALETETKSLGPQWVPMSHKTQRLGGVEGKEKKRREKAREGGREDSGEDAGKERPWPSVASLTVPPFWWPCRSGIETCAAFASV